MRGIINIILLFSLIGISGCGTLPSGERISSGGGILTRHFMSGPSQFELQQKANQRCRAYGKKASSVYRIYRGKLFSRSEYDRWSYKCVSTTVQSKRNISDASRRIETEKWKNKLKEQNKKNADQIVTE